MPHDSAAGGGAQIINPLGIGTVASYFISDHNGRLVENS
jgi:hypothetical protein